MVLILLRERKDLRRGWYIVRRDETSLLTSLGEVVYHKTLFKNVDTGESCYLLDQLMGLEHHARITEDAQARILQSDGGLDGPPFFYIGGFDYAVITTYPVLSPVLFAGKMRG